ncbi:hypothetical protein [Natronorubrum sp. DTA28]|uniref:hypothetical protein n=1 Tax=Natronorubrum sp. DTA28 TaxID=3447019 RepID=UPI003F84BA60
MTGEKNQKSNKMDYLSRLGRFYCGLCGIVTIIGLHLLVTTAFLFLFPDFRFLFMVNWTIFNFILTAATAVILLKILFVAKRAIWWLVGTQTADFSPPEQEGHVEPTENLVEKSRQKGTMWFSGGLLIGYVIAGTGTYVRPSKASFVREYPDLPIIDPIISLLSGLPILSDVGFVSDTFSIVHPIEYVFLGAVLIPMTIGLWNFMFVFGSVQILYNRHQRKLFRRELVYVLGILTGTLLLAVAIYFEI